MGREIMNEVRISNNKIKYSSKRCQKIRKYYKVYDSGYRMSFGEVVRLIIGFELYTSSNVVVNGWFKEKYKVLKINLSYKIMKYSKGLIHSWIKISIPVLVR